MFPGLLSGNYMMCAGLIRVVGGFSVIALTVSLYGFSSAHASPTDLHFANQDELDAYIRKHDTLITESPDTATYYLRRADAMFLSHRFNGTG
jgi:hypothetical protein